MKSNPLNRRRLVWMAGAVALLSSCGGGSDEPSRGPLPVGGSGTAVVQDFATGFNTPWGMAFLPDGRLLVTEKGGALRLVSANGTSVSPVSLSLPGGLVTAGQGGLLDVAIDPDFSNGQPWVYLTYSQPGTGGSGTAVMRGQLDLANPNALTNATQIFQQLPKVGGDGHFGSRLVFANDKTLFVTLGERMQGSPAQDLNSHLGKVVRINRDGTIPVSNPAFGVTQRPGIWTYGHRNPQGAALHPSGELWVSEHGPQGGDEINIALAGRNFGWPNVSYGCEYGASYPGNDNTSCRIGGTGGVHTPNFVEPLTFWVPTSIAPSDMMFYNGAMFPEWQGNLFMGSLAGTALWRMTVTNTAVTAREEVLPSAINVRIRDVAQGPDGAIYFIEETNGRIVRITR
ncbi:MAG TPA: PQQ-dependent sugar dehydrogenase [Burkholderiaceae bacterium]|nr:PQQ-dependent sugar dehydrogenase [Burkholderiaceae bacterium]